MPSQMLPPMLLKTPSMSSNGTEETRARLFVSNIFQHQSPI